MLLPTMTRQEVTTEILRERIKVETDVFDRLVEEYDRERRKLKIDKAKVYSKAYPIKTAGKNTWILFIQKSPGCYKYRQVSDAVACAVVYYYSAKGLQAFRYCEDEKFMEVFNGHFFVRYNERMNLNLVHMVDMIKAFFMTNGYLQMERKVKGDKDDTVGICKEGMTLGNYYHNPEWLVHKTFINRDLKRKDQDEHETLLMAQAQLQLLKAQLKGSFANDQVLKQIVGDRALSIAEFDDDPELLTYLKHEVLPKI